MKAEILNNKIVLSGRILNKVLFHIKMIPGHRYNGLFGYWEVPVTNKNINSLVKLGFDIDKIKNKGEKDWKQIKKKFPFLFDYQVEAVIKANSLGNILIADDCGLGKTIEGFASAKLQLDNGKVTRIIIVCENPIKVQWYESNKKFFGVESIIIKGDKKQRQTLYSEKHKIIIINYHQLSLDYYELHPLIRGSVMILDEASLLKNPKTKRVKVFKLYNPLYKIALTGTPIENKLEDAYNIANLLYKDWMKKWEFNKNYINWETSDEGYSIKEGYKNLDGFMKRLQDISIRRKQSDVEGFPTLVVYDRFIEMTKNQEIIEEEIIEKGDKGMGVFPLLNMVEDDLQLIEKSEAKSLYDYGIKHHHSLLNPKSNKLKELKVILDEVGDKKIVIFTRSKVMAKIIYDELGFLKSLIAYGGVDADTLLKKFKNNDDIRFLVTTDVFCRGVDIPFSSCLVNFDILWNPAQLKQRIDRCHRITSKSQTKVFNLISVSDKFQSLEQYMYNVMGGKKALSETVMNFDEKHQLLDFFNKRKLISSK